MGNYSKLWGALFGVIVALMATFGLSDGTTVFGIDQTTFLAIANATLTPLMVWAFPANKQSNG